MTLSLYLARRFLVTFLMVLGGLFTVIFLIDLIEQVRRFPDLGFADLIGLSFLHVPRTLYHVLPLVMTLAAIAMFLGLARTSELVAIRASGQSALRALVPAVVAALLFGLVAVSLVNPIVAATARRYDVVTGTGFSGAALAGNGLWMRQGGEAGPWVIHAESGDTDSATLSDVTFLGLTPAGEPVRRFDAASARLDGGRWIATDAKEWVFDGRSNPEAAATRHAELALPATLTPDQLRESTGAPESVSVWNLPTFIARLDEAGFSSRRHAVWMQMELALPLLLAAMVLMGAGFTMRHARFGHGGLSVLLALLAGIAIFFVRNFAQVLGESGQIPVVLAAWTPPVAALLLALSLVLHLEDG